MIYIEQKYFDDAKDNFLKELVDFNSRDDFDRFMCKVENSYFDNIAKVAKNPYAESGVPQYPPKPYQEFQQSKRRSSRARDSSEEVGSPARSMRSFDQFVETVKNLNL